MASSIGPRRGVFVGAGYGCLSFLTGVLQAEDSKAGQIRRTAKEKELCAGIVCLRFTLWLYTCVRGLLNISFSSVVRVLICQPSQPTGVEAVVRQPTDGVRAVSKPRAHALGYFMAPLTGLQPCCLFSWAHQHTACPLSSGFIHLQQSNLEPRGVQPMIAGEFRKRCMKEPELWFGLGDSRFIGGKLARLQVGELLFHRCWRGDA